MTVFVVAGFALLGTALIGFVPSVPARYAVWLAGYPMYAGWVGYLLIRWESGGVGLIHHSVAMLGFGMGVFLVATSASWPAPDAIAKAVKPRAGTAMLVFLSLLTAYHFAVIGLPILSPDIDILRWNFTGSGLGGLPGRAYSHGLTFLMVYTFIAANRAEERDRPAWRKVRNQTIAAVFISRVAGGFKGELLEMVMTMTVATLLSTSHQLRLPDGFRKRIVTGVGLALAAAIVISTQYYATAWNQSQGSSIGEQFVRRSTIMVSEAGTTLINIADRRERPFGGNSVVNDLDVYLGRSFGLWNVDGKYMLNQHLASKHFGRDILYGRELSLARFIVPVTPGFAALAYFDFGWVGVVAIAVLLGALMIAMARAALSARTCAAAFALVIEFEALRSYAQKGDIAYAAVNFTLVLVGIIAGLKVFDRLLRRPAANPHARARRPRLVRTQTRSRKVRLLRHTLRPVPTGRPATSSASGPHPSDAEMARRRVQTESRIR